MNAAGTSLANHVCGTNFSGGGLFLPLNKFRPELILGGSKFNVTVRPLPAVGISICLRASNADSRASIRFVISVMEICNLLSWSTA